MLRSFKRVLPPTHSNQKMRAWMSIVAGLLLGLLALCGLMWYLWWQTPLPISSPISQLTRFRFFVPESLMKKPQQSKTVYGFLPYWNLNKVELLPTITNMSYFGLTLSRNGSLTQDVDEEGNIAYSRMQSEAFLDILQANERNQTANEIVIKLFSADDARAFLQSEAAQATFLSQLDALLLAYPFSGVNLDVEINDNAQSLQEKFSSFVAQLDDHLAQKFPGTKLSIDVYASAAERTNVWDLTELASHVDYIIVMAYDFHRRSSPQAGPVAPLLGGELWNKDINIHLKEILQQVPPEKILLGIPFYGYEWQTTSNRATALTHPGTGATATYDRVQELLKNEDQYDVKEEWNEAALSPYLTYKKDGKQYVIYYDNARSISYKMDYVNQLGLGGVAIWALGYEGNTTELWDVIGKKLHQTE